MINIKNIHGLWGSTVEFSDPLSFFNQPYSYWRNLLYERKLLVFKKMTFTVLDFAKTGKYFGLPWNSENYKKHKETSFIIEDNGKEYTVCNFNSDATKTRISHNQMPYHADIPNHDSNPFPIRSLWMIENPNSKNSGNTFFLNIEDGLNELPGHLSEIVSSVKVKQQDWHNMDPTQEKIFNLIKEHPITNQKSLRLNYYVNNKFPRSKNAWIKEVYISEQIQEDCSLIQTFIDHLSLKKNLYYEHKWDNYDIIVYDNYSFIHGRKELILNNGDIRSLMRLNIDHMSNDEFKKAYSDNQV